MIIEAEFVLDQPVERVFALMAEIERRPEWVTPAVQRTRLADGAGAVGTRYRAIDRYPGRRTEFVHEITACEVDRLIEESWGGPMAGTMATRFAADHGSTTVRIITDIRPSGLLRGVAYLMKGWLVRSLRKDFDRLEELIASEAST